MNVKNIKIRDKTNGNDYELNLASNGHYRYRKWVLGYPRGSWQRVSKSEYYARLHNSREFEVFAANLYDENLLSETEFKDLIAYLKTGKEYHLNNAIQDCKDLTGKELVIYLNNLSEKNHEICSTN